MAGSKPDGAGPEILAAIESLEGDAALFREENFLGRAGALDAVETGILDRIAGLLDRGAARVGTGDMPKGATGEVSGDGLMRLRERAEELRARLEAADERLFRRLRAEIRGAAGSVLGFREWLEPYLGPEMRAAGGSRGAGYDHLDTFFNGLLHPRPLPGETQPRESGMVFYQKTPARIILELAEAAGLSEADVFYDVGSGLGQVAILIRLLSGAATRGVEVEPAYCDYARACAADLGLSRVEFAPVDAREADYSAGTVFFMYTPCEGRMLEAVLERLRSQAGRGKRLFTYGPCTREVERSGWRLRGGRSGAGDGELGEFVLP